MKYPVYIEHKETIFIAHAPDFNNCRVIANSLEEAFQAIKNAVQSHVELRIQSGETVPQPSNWNQISSLSKSKRNRWAVIECNVEELYKKYKNRFNKEIHP